MKTRTQKLIVEIKAKGEMTDPIACRPATEQS
jgi:hypothetical protein